jgi:outer membrane protein assembly factor BamB
MKRSANYVALLLLSLLTSPWAKGAGSDWPQWQGPQRDGVSSETGLLTSWPAQGPPLVWKANHVGAGYSGVAIANGRIFTMGDETDGSLIYALSERDGKPIWEAKLGKAGGGNGYPGTRCTPTVDGELVYALGQFGDLVCVEAATGKERWRKNLGSDFRGAVPEWGYAESPLVDGEKVICTPGGADGAIIALNKSTGAEVWRTKEFKDNAAYASLIMAEIAGQRQYIQLTDASVVGVASADGKVLWRASRPGRVAVIDTPIFYDNCVYVTSEYGVGCNLFRISANAGQLKAEQVYANKVMVSHHGGVVRAGEYLYGYSAGKGWVCQEFKTGKSVWAEKDKLGKGSILAADGHLYLRGEDRGTMVLLEASPKGYKQAGQFEQPDRSELNAWPHPVIANGKLYLRDQNVVLCYNVKK